LQVGFFLSAVTGGGAPTLSGNSAVCVQGGQVPLGS
jgi:hypothetical protein